MCLNLRNGIQVQLDRLDGLVLSKCHESGRNNGNYFLTEWP